MGILKSWFGPPDIDALLAKRDAAKLVKALAHKDADISERARQALVELQNSSETNETIFALISAAGTDGERNDTLFDIITEVEISDGDLLARVLLNTIEELEPRAQQEMRKNSRAGPTYAAAIGFRGRLLRHLGQDAVPALLANTDSPVIGDLANGLLQSMGGPAIEAVRKLATAGDGEINRQARTFLTSKWAAGAE